MKEKKSNKWKGFSVPSEVIDTLKTKRPTFLPEEKKISRKEIHDSKDKREKKAQPTRIEISLKWRLEPKEINVNLGTCLSTRQPVFWAPSHQRPKRLANLHILILGKSGSGKTQTTMALAYEFSRSGVPSIIFDFHGEYIKEEFINATHGQIIDANDDIKLNPLEIPFDPYTKHRQSYEKVVYQVSKTISKICKLGIIQESILREAIFEAFYRKGLSESKVALNFMPPTLSDVWDILIEKQKGGNSNIKNLMARVDSIFSNRVFLGGLGSINFDDILSNVTILRLDNLATEELMIAVSRFILEKIYINMLMIGPSHLFRIFCIIDEAHKLYGDRTLIHLIKETRKYGIGLILSSQEAKDFDNSMFSNTATLISLQPGARDAKIIAKNIGLINQREINKARKKMIKLSVGQALLKNDHHEPYTLIQIDPFEKRIQ